MAIDLNRSPYYDDFDSSKNYTKILAIPGRVVQAREFTQVQSILKDQIQQLGDAVLANGTVVSGCPLSINDDGNRIVVTIGAGKLYIDGAVRAVDESTVEISGSGIEYICAKVVSDIVTEDIDSSLNDLVQNNDNYGKPGAHRLRERVIFLSIQSNDGDTSVVSNQNAARVYTLQDGSILTSNSTPTVTTISNTTSTGDIAETLARRTYDENGSYKVDGLEIENQHEQDSENILVSVTPGKAYVNGYEIQKIVNTSIPIDYETGVIKRSNEPKTYRAGVNSYSLNNTPVRNLEAVTSTIEVTGATITKGSNGGKDNITVDNTNGRNVQVSGITEILKIYTKNQGVVDKVYEAGTHFDYNEDDKVDWSIAPDYTSENQPQSGSTYYIDFRYQREMIIGTDVQLVYDYNEDTGFFDSKIEYLKEEYYPVPGTKTLVDYYYYRARADLITLSQTGEFKVLKGKATRLNVVVPPANNDQTLMTIGTVVVLPGYSGVDCNEHLRNIEIISEYNTRLSQREIYRMKSRLDNLEYNTAMTDLDKEALEGESATLLRGILTDGFIGFSKADVSYPGFSASMDVDAEELTLGMNTYEVIPTINTGSTTVKTFKNSYLAPYTEVVALSQTQATSSFKVNPYAAYDPMCLLEISPSIDNWIEEETITVSGGTTTQSTTLRRWWYHKGASWAESEKQKWLALTGTTGEQLGWSNYSSSSQKSTTSYIYDQLITYMRQIDITVTGSNYRANADQLVGYFNDKPVNLTPLSGTSAGTAYVYPKNGKTYTTVKANAEGEFTAKFKIPANTPCGSVVVSVHNTLNDKGGTAVFTAEGHKQIKRVTTQTIKTVVNTTDPLAQSFQFDKDVILTKVGLFFSVKDSSKNCLLQIRNMVNGFPGTDVFDEVVIKSSVIKTSSTAGTETVVTLNRPVYCKANTQYCFVVLSDSNAYEMWVATIGEKNISTQNTVVSQPYGAGLMFSSSNAMTWSEHQTSDVKFKLYRANFSGTGSLVYNNAIFSNNISRALVVAQSVDFKNDGIVWYYKTTGTDLPSDDDWMPIETYYDHEFGKNIKSLQFKAELTATANGTTSPILDTSAIAIKGFSNKPSGMYVSRAIQNFENSYNTIAISFEAAHDDTTDGTGFTVYYLTEDGGQWQQATQVGNAVEVDRDFSRYSYLNKVPESNFFRVRIDLYTENEINRPRIRKLMNILRNE